MVIAQSVGTCVDKTRVHGLSPRNMERVLAVEEGARRPSEHCRATLDPLVPRDPDRNKVVQKTSLPSFDQIRSRNRNFGTKRFLFHSHGDNGFAVVASSLISSCAFTFWPWSSFMLGKDKLALNMECLSPFLKKK